MEIKNDFSKLSNEVLIYLGIKNTFFSFPGGITSMIKPLYIDKDKWEVIRHQHCKIHSGRPDRSGSRKREYFR